MCKTILRFTRFRRFFAKQFKPEPWKTQISYPDPCQKVQYQKNCFFSG
jgi:hypothetical protein